MDTSDQNDHLSEARRVINIEIDALHELARCLDGSFNQAVETVKRIVDAGGKVVGVGVGKSGNIGRKITATLTSTGTPAVWLSTVDALHGDLGILRDGDAVLALSYSGETAELLNLLPHLRKFSITVIAITGGTASTLARHADIVLNSKVDREACPLELAPTSSSTAMLVLGDALAVALMKSHRFGRDDFARFHPGGTLGRHLLLTARDMMRPLERTVFVAHDTPVTTVVQQIVARKSGAAIVLAPDQTLCGIFTIGDFARAYCRDATQFEGATVDLFTTRSPVVVHCDQLTTEVLRVLAERRVDELIVVDSESRVPVGLIDCQDLSRLKLLA